MPSLRGVVLAAAPVILVTLSLYLTFPPSSFPVSHSPPQANQSSFDAVEKTLEVFHPLPRTGGDLRAVPRGQWDALLRPLGCRVLSEVAGRDWHAYLLSESSLFVGRSSVVVKTCGTITLLRGLEEVLRIVAGSLGDGPVVVRYSRGEFFEPEGQHAPHTSWASELTHLSQVLRSPAAEIDHLEVAGPRRMDGFFSMASVPRGQLALGSWKPHPRLELVLLDVPDSLLTSYCEGSEDHLAHREAIRAAFSGSVVDDYDFSPCGYSANGVSDASFWTIHLTPQQATEYVSFETSDGTAKVGCRWALAFLDLFSPGRIAFRTSRAKADFSEAAACTLNGMAKRGYVRDTGVTTSGALPAALEMDVEVWRKDAKSIGKGKSNKELDGFIDDDNSNGHEHEL
jgi:S-adenosylmethionine decarboxylase